MSQQQTEGDELEVRAVEVHDPDLSDRTNELLTAEAQEALKETSVLVPRSRQHPADGERPVDAGPALGATGARLLLTTVVSTFVVVGLIALLSGASWWFLPIAVAVLVALLLLMAKRVLHMTSIREHASPTTTAAMQAEGITNPDEFFTAIVDEFTETSQEDVSEHRTVSVQEDASRAGAEQPNAGTQTSGPSEAVGP